MAKVQFTIKNDKGEDVLKRAKKSQLVIIVTIWS